MTKKTLKTQPFAQPPYVVVKQQIIEMGLYFFEQGLKLSVSKRWFCSDEVVNFHNDLHCIFQGRIEFYSKVHFDG